jgi:glucose-1-phosphate thymidylyltransferase
VKLAESYVKDEPFVVYLGDNLLQGGISKYVKKSNSSNYDAMVLLKEVDAPEELWRGRNS